MCSTCSFKFLEGILGFCHRLYFKILIPSGFFTSPQRTSLILGYAASAQWGIKAPFWGFVLILPVTSASCQTTCTVQLRLPKLRKKARTISSTFFAQSVPVYPVCPSLSFVPLSNRKERNNPTGSPLHFFPFCSLKESGLPFPTSISNLSIPWNLSKVIFKPMFSFIQNFFVLGEFAENHFTKWLIIILS